VPAIERGHGAIGFSFDSLLFEVVPFIDGRLSASHADFDFHMGVLPVEAERDERLALHRAGGKQFGDLRFMEQEFAGAPWFVLGMTRTFVGLNIRVVEVNLVFLDSRKGIVEVRQTRPDGFDFRSLKFDARLDFFENLIVVERAAIGSDLGGHKSLPREEFSRLWRLARAETHT
jgi:hypothetical protein